MPTSALRRMRPAALPVGLALAVLLLALAGCSTPEQEASPESGEFSGPDVAFLQGMIPHHQDAVAMAELVPERTERTELVELAAGIVEQQESEIEEMRELLDRAGAQQPDAPAAEGDHDEAGHELTEEEITELRGLDGTPFDLTFLDRMIAHHESAVRDARRYLDRGDNPEVIALAERIIADQEAEVEQMQRWRAEWAAEEALG